MAGAANKSPAGATKPRKKATRLEKLYRVRTLQTLCVNGCSTLDLEDHCIKEWGLSLPNARLYIKQALEGMVESLTETDKRRMALVIYYRLENSYKLARAIRNPSAMIAACDAMARIYMKQAPDDEIAANQAAREAARESAAHDPREDFE